MTGRPPAGDPVLRTLRSGRGGRTGVAGVAAGDEVFAVRPRRRRSRLHGAARRAAGGQAAGARARRECRDPSARAYRLAGVFAHGRLSVNERVLIDGAAGGVGGFAVQLARASGAHVIGTASAADLGLVRQLGAHEAVDAAARFEDAVEPVDVVFDTAGGERLRRSLAVLRAGGRLVSEAEEPPDGGVYFTVEPNRDQLRSLARLADVGELRSPSVEVFPLTSAREAFARSLEPGRRGKVVLAVV